MYTLKHFSLKKKKINDVDIFSSSPFPSSRKLLLDKYVIPEFL
jgi:hypothetical protein